MTDIFRSAEYARAKLAKTEGGRAVTERPLAELRKGVRAVKARYPFSYISFYISRPYYPQHPFWYVMIRQHDLSGCHYGYSFKMNDVEARAVVRARVLEPWFVHEAFFQ